MQVIDELVITLGLDPTQFNEGQKRALEDFKKTQEAALATAKQIESQGQKTQEFFNGMKRGALELMAVFLGGRGIKEFVSQVTQADASVGRLADTVHQSAGELSNWQGTFRLVGGSAQDAVASIDAIETSLQKARITAQVPDFARYIGGIFDKTGRLKEAAEVFKELADLVKGMDPALAKAFLTEIAPGMNPAAIQLIIRGRDEIDKLQRTMKGLGTTTAEDASQAGKLMAAWTQLTTIGENFGRKILTFLSPALQSVLNIASGIIAIVSNKLFDTPLLEEEPITGLPADKVEQLHEGLRALGQIESKGDYSALGPVVEKGAYAGDRAYGKYQVMGRNIPQWTKEVLGVAMTPQEFLASKSAQEDVAFAKFGALLKKYGNLEDAASAWQSGRPLSEAAAAGATDGHASTTEYVRRFNEALISKAIEHRQNLPARPGAPRSVLTPGEMRRLREIFPPEGAGAPAAATSGPGGGRTENNNSTSTQIGSLTVVLPNATDARSMAAELPDAVRQVNFAAGANYGLT